MSTPRRQRVYEPRRLMGQSVEELRREMQQELDEIALTVGQLTDFSYYPQAAEPERFQEGSFRYFRSGVAVTGIASTTAGMHQFRGGAWRRLAEV